MRKRLTRRRLLALAGSLTGTLTISGCLNAGTDSYWDSPPSFDETGLESVTDRSVPDRPALIPVTVADDQREAFANRVDDLLDPIPDPLTAETVPNGELRQQIATEREAAHDALERMADATTALEVATAAADACECAGTAAGTWAAISTAHALEDVTLSEDELSNELSRLTDELPADAPDPLEGSVVYGPIESWLDTASRNTLVGRSSIGDRADPSRNGTAVGDVERIRAEIEAGDHVRDRYLETLEQPRPIEDHLTAALETLESTVEDRFLEFHGDDDVDYLRTGPSLDDILARDPPRDEPGVRLLSSELYQFFDEIRFEPVAWPEGTVTHPAHRFRTTYRTFATLDALETIRDRVDDGDDLFPNDGDALRQNREAAIDAVDELLGLGSPLERWIGWRLVPRFDDPAETVRPDANPDRRAIASANGDYVWIETMARAARDASPLVEDALP